MVGIGSSVSNREDSMRIVVNMLLMEVDYRWQRHTQSVSPTLDCHPVLAVAI